MVFRNVYGRSNNECNNSDFHLRRKLWCTLRCFCCPPLFIGDGLFHFISTVITFFTGIFAAYYIAKAPRIVKGVLDVILTLPKVLPPTVVGYLLLWCAPHFAEADCANPQSSQSLQINLRKILDTTGQPASNTHGCKA